MEVIAKLKQGYHFFGTLCVYALAINTVRCYLRGQSWALLSKDQKYMKPMKCGATEDC